MTRVMAFSDLHMFRSRAADLVEASKEADLVIGAGDFCNMRTGLDEAISMLDGIQAPFVTVPGNAESDEELRRAVPPGATVLHGTGIKVAGLQIFGLGGAVPPTPFGGWSWDLTEVEAEKRLSSCSEADVMVVHSPPKGIADVSSAGQSLGSKAIRAAIERVQPRLVLCGHIHDSWGERGRIGATEVFNLGPTPNWFDLDD